MKANSIQKREVYSGYALICTCKFNKNNYMCKIKW